MARKRAVAPPRRKSRGGTLSVATPGSMSHLRTRGEVLACCIAQGCFLLPNQCKGSGARAALKGLEPRRACDPEPLPAFCLCEDTHSLVFAELHLASCECCELARTREDVGAENALGCDPDQPCAQKPAAKGDECVWIERKRLSRSLKAVPCRAQ